MLFRSEDVILIIVIAVLQAITKVAADEQADLIVVGSRGLSAAGRFLLGSVSDGILHHVHCSVLVVKPPAESPHA